MKVKDNSIIIYLAGNPKRFDIVYELYLQNPNNHVLISSFNDYSPLRGNKTLLKQCYFDLKPEQVITEYFSTSTYNSALEISKILKKFEFDQLYIVTSDYHIYRTKLIFDKILSEYHLYYVPMKEKYKTKNYISEMIKFILYFFKSYKFYTKSSRIYNNSIYSELSRTSPDE